MRHRLQKKAFVTVLALCGVLIGASAHAGERGHNGGEREGQGHGPFTIAVFGDWPYSLPLVAASPLLIESINSDPKVSLVLHVGDIHSGSMPCTGAGLLPLPAGSNPAWNLAIFALFEHFVPPVVYTPGDNEWTDCHKTKQFSSGAPLNELAAVRSLFFPTPGQTLGVHKRQVKSQANMANAAFPADAQFVESPTATTPPAPTEASPGGHGVRRRARHGPTAVFSVLCSEAVDMPDPGAVMAGVTMGRGASRGSLPGNLAT